MIFLFVVAKKWIKINIRFKEYKIKNDIFYRKVKLEMRFFFTKNKTRHNILFFLLFFK